LIHTRPLDPSSDSQLRDIERNLLYVESQLGQAMAAVNTALAEYGNGNTSRRFRLPSFATMTRTLTHQRNIMSNLERRCSLLKATAANLGLSTVQRFVFLT
jgi:hypothetical protein